MSVLIFAVEFGSAYGYGLALFWSLCAIEYFIRESRK